MLFEGFWSAFGRDWRSPVRSVLALKDGRAALKRYLASASAVEVATLPYDAEVIAYIEAWREPGGRTALVTASDRMVAEEIAAHLGIFDEVHGSDGRVNLKGSGKRVSSRTGSQRAALPIWATHRRICRSGNAPRRPSPSTRRTACAARPSGSAVRWSIS